MIIVDLRLIQSALKNEYISEEDYELSDWYPRIEFARNHIPLLPFTTNIHIASSSSGLEMVEQMINLAGGCVVKNIEQANIVISDTPIKGIDKIVVNDTWLFDSIEQWKCMFKTLRAITNYVLTYFIYRYLYKCLYI